MKKILLLTISTLTLTSFSVMAQSKKQIKKSVPKKRSVEIITSKKNDENTTLVWTTDVMKADSISKKTNKPIFGFFTGSDWCGWCHKLQNDVFAKKDFIKWAKEKVVLLELDFPRKKQLPQELQQQNYGLAQAFQVQGYPTVWLFTINRDSTTGANVKLNALGSLGYPSGAVLGKEEIKFLETANSILNKGK
ncbi:MAG: thioredoxin family protein [Bacteroidetes bacterium]|nr:thioredoxin family protein [Bacteroidota bacterium]